MRGGRCGVYDGRELPKSQQDTLLGAVPAVTCAQPEPILSRTLNLCPTMSATAGTIAIYRPSGFGEVTTMTVDEILREALALDAETRASMAHELLSSLESLSEDEVERLWIDEARRRSAEAKAGRAHTISADESIARVRARR